MRDAEYIVDSLLGENRELLGELGGVFGKLRELRVKNARLGELLSRADDEREQALLRLAISFEEEINALKVENFRLRAASATRVTWPVKCGPS